MAKLFFLQKLRTVDDAHHVKLRSSHIVVMDILPSGRDFYFRNENVGQKIDGCGSVQATGLVQYLISLICHVSRTHAPVLEPIKILFRQPSEDSTWKKLETDPFLCRWEIKYYWMLFLEEMSGEFLSSEQLSVWKSCLQLRKNKTNLQAKLALRVSLRAKQGSAQWINEINLSWRAWSDIEKNQLPRKLNS